MPYSITTKDGITIDDIPDDVPPDSPELKAQVASMRASMGQQAPEVVTAPEEVPETTMGGVSGGIVRGAGPVAAGAALGAAAGAPFAGVGAIPGAAAGAGAVALSSLVGDPVVRSINSMFGTNYKTPSESWEHLFTKMGVAEPKTTAERFVQAASSGAGGAAGFQSAGRAIEAAAAAPTAKAVGAQLAAQPMQQVAGGVGAGLGAQAAQEAGVGPLGQLAAGLAGGVIGSGAAGLRVAPRATEARTAAAVEAEKRAIPVMTSDVMPPGTFAAKWLQSAGEKIPLAGTGKAREVQQAARADAVRNLLLEFGADDAAKASANVMDDLAKKRSADLTKYASLKNEVIDRLDDAGGKSQIVQNPNWKPHENFSAFFEKMGFKVKESGSAHSKSRYVDIEDLDSGGTVTVRFSDHPQSSHAITLHGPAEINVGNFDGANASGLDDAVQMAVKELNKWRASLGVGEIAVPKKASGAVPVPSAVREIDSQIAKLGSLRSESVSPVIARLEDFKASIQGQGLRNVEELRKQLGEAFKAPELTSVRGIGDKAVGAIYGALRKDMGDFIKSAGERRDLVKWEVANKRLSEMSGELKMSTLKSVLSRGEATPEVVNSMLFSSKPSEIQQLYSGLTQRGKASAQVAILSKAAEKAGGIENISPDKFANEVNRLGKSVGIFFSGEELDRVRGLTRALELTKRGGQAGVAPPTGVQVAIPVGAAVLTDMLGGAGAATATGAGIGIAARVYESPAVRNILVKIPKVVKGSQEEAALVKRLMAAIQQQQESTEE